MRLRNPLHWDWFDTACAVLALAVAALIFATAAHGATPVREPESPSDNPLSVKAAALGWKVFNDPIASANGTISCATCHDPNMGYSDAGPVSVGIVDQQNRPQLGTRRSPTLINVGYIPQGEKRLFWDMHAVNLEGQLNGPLQNPVEMGQQTLTQVARRFDRIPGYHAAFVDAYGVGCTPNTLVDSLSAFERTIVVNDTPYQRALRGELWALSDREAVGMTAFIKVGCADCHAGTDLSDRLPHNVGSPLRDRNNNVDRGAGVTFGRQLDGAFKTPTLLEVASHPPYLHNGIAPTLSDAILFHTKLEPPTQSQLDSIVDFLTMATHSKHYPVFVAPALPR